jgi:Uncharacterized protein conserved in bacteria
LPRLVRSELLALPARRCAGSRCHHTAVLASVRGPCRWSARTPGRCWRAAVIQRITLPRYMMTVAELPEYLRRASKLLGDDDRRAVVEYLAAHPKAGDLIEGTGGVRKLRWGRDGRGKSGGVRVIYYFHSEAMPLYLLTLFAKNERANLTKAERNELAGLVEVLVSLWLER